MTIFSRRPAALAALICIPLAFAAAYSNTIVRLLLLISAIVLTVVMALRLRRSSAQVATMNAFSFVLIAGVMVSLQLMTALALYDLNIGKFDRYAESGENATITAVVTEERGESDWYANYALSLMTIDGKSSFAAGLMLCDRSYGLSVGDVIACEVGFVNLSELYADIGSDRFDVIADGINFACEPMSEIVTTGEKTTFRTFTSKLRTRIGAAIEVCSDRETMPVIKALLLSDKSGLGVLRRDMSRAGVSHLLALSGLHLSVICTMIELIGRRFRITLWLRRLIQIGGAGVFLVISAFPRSLLRAAVMLLIMSLGRLSGRDRDPMTALFVSCWLITLADPAALHDIGFQLSFTATLGVIITLDAEDILRMKLSRYTRKRPVVQKLLHTIFGIFVSIGATLFVLPLQWLHFREMSLVAVPATFILAPLITIILWMIIPFAILACLRLTPAALTLGKLIALPTLALRYISGEFSASQVLIPLGYRFVTVFAVGFILTAVILNRRGVGFLRLLGLFCGFLIIYTGTVKLGEQIRARSNELCFVNYKTNDAAVIYSSGECLVVDISAGSSGLMRSVAMSLPENRITEIDTVMLTHLHSSHAKALKKLCESKMVRRFLIPAPEDDKEVSYFDSIKEVASGLGVELMTYEPQAIVTTDFEKIELSIMTGSLKRSKHPLIGISFDLGEKRVFYAGAAYWEGDERINSDIVVIGTHGPKIKSEPEFDGIDISSTENIIFKAKAGN